MKHKIFTKGCMDCLKLKLKGVRSEIETRDRGVIKQICVQQIIIMML